MFNSIAYNKTQSLDLYLVEQTGRPVVVCLHGGGFNSGNRRDERCTQAAALLTDAGFNCASISYSLGCAEDRFSMWPRNLLDVADAIGFLHEQASIYGYDFSRFGMLGFSAGCCLSNLYIQGGRRIFDHFRYKTTVYSPVALAGFYGPYDFRSRQRERRSDSDEVNQYHSPAYWLRRNSVSKPPPVLHIQGDQDEVVTPDQHRMFRDDYEQRGHSFMAVDVPGFGHSFAPRERNVCGQELDLAPVITAFFSSYLNGNANSQVQD